MSRASALSAEVVGLVVAGVVLGRLGSGPLMSTAGRCS